MLIVWPEIAQMPNLSAQAQKFLIFEKKLSLGVRSPWRTSTIKIPSYESSVPNRRVGRNKHAGGRFLKYH